MKIANTAVLGITVVLAFLSAGCGSVGSQLWIPMESEGQSYNLSATLDLPEEKKAPYPVVVLNHGGFGPGQIPGSLDQAASFFVEQGFAVLRFWRSGHMSSGGRNHEPVSNVGDTFFSGLSHAKKDLDAVMRHVSKNPLLDSSRVVVGGRSRGGMLSVVYAAEASNPSIRGVINFAGNWWGDRGIDYTREAFEVAGAGHKVPNLWLYGKGDVYSSDNSIELYLNRFKQKGGLVDFKFYPAGSGGHYIVEYPSVWRKDVQDFLRRLGL